MHSPKESFHLNRGADVCSFTDLLESVVSLDRKLDGILAHLDDLGSSCHLRADRSCREVLDVDYDSNRNPTFRQVFLDRRRCGVFHLIDHDWRAEDFGHMLVKVRDRHVSGHFDFLSSRRSNRYVSRSVHPHLARWSNFKERHSSLAEIKKKRDA